MKVYALMYGCCDLEGESLCKLFHKRNDAIECAVASAQEIFDDDPDMSDEGFILNELSEDGNGIATVGIQIAATKYDTEWWYVQECEVQ